MSVHTFPIPSGWMYTLARGPTAVGLQKRREFINDLLTVLGDCRLLWVPLSTDTTTSTTVDRSGLTVTWDATIASRFSNQGSGALLDFDGTGNEGDTPDDNLHSFGNSSQDEPFSVGGLVVPDANNALMTIIGKMNSASAEEWELFLDASGHMNFQVTDESASATLEARYAAAVGTSAVLLGASYDGAGAVSGMSLYTNGISRTVTNDSSGTYVAMENTAALTHIGARYTTKERFFNGRIGFVYVTAKALNRHEHWAINQLVNGYYGLTL